MKSLFSRKNKKGFMATLEALPTVVILLGIVVIIVAILGSMTDNTVAITGQTSCPIVGTTQTTYNSAWRLCQNGTTANYTPSGYAWNATGNASSGWLQFSNYLPQILILVFLMVSLNSFLPQNYKNLFFQKVVLFSQKDIVHHQETY